MTHAKQQNPKALFVGHLDTLLHLLPTAEITSKLEKFRRNNNGITRVTINKNSSPPLQFDLLPWYKTSELYWNQTLAKNYERIVLLVAADAKSKVYVVNVKGEAYGNFVRSYLAERKNSKSKVHICFLTKENKLTEGLIGSVISSQKQVDVFRKEGCLREWTGVEARASVSAGKHLSPFLQTFLGCTEDYCVDSMEVANMMQLPAEFGKQQAAYSNTMLLILLILALVLFMKQSEEEKKEISAVLVPPEQNERYEKLWRINSSPESQQHFRFLTGTLVVRRRGHSEDLDCSSNEYRKEDRVSLQGLWTQTSSGNYIELVAGSFEEASSVNSSVISVFLNHRYQFIMAEGQHFGWEPMLELDFMRKQNYSEEAMNSILSDALKVQNLSLPLSSLSSLEYLAALHSESHEIDLTLFKVDGSLDLFSNKRAAKVQPVALSSKLFIREIAQTINAKKDIISELQANMSALETTIEEVSTELSEVTSILKNANRHGMGLHEITVAMFEERNRNISKKNGLTAKLEQLKVSLAGIEKEYNAQISQVENKQTELHHSLVELMKNLCNLALNNEEQE